MTAQNLAKEGHKILFHGRGAAKLEAAAAEVEGDVDIFAADLSRIADIRDFVAEVRERHGRLDVLINNAGVLKTAQTRTEGGHDVRFMVNTFAPYALTRALLPIIPKEGRIVNLSSAAQAPIEFAAMLGEKQLGPNDAYAQSKLALTIWIRELATELSGGPVVVAVNPGSLLASKMVKEGYGIAGNDLSIGADILRQAALGGSFSDATGKYFDNDSGQFAQPHPAALDATHSAQVMQGIADALKSLS